MEKIDIRQLSDRERALLRKQVIRLRKQGKGNTEVSDLLTYLFMPQVGGGNGTKEKVIPCLLSRNEVEYMAKNVT